MRIIRNMQDQNAPGTAGPAPGGHACDDARCRCGNLLARVVGGEVELKCRRCKQVWRLALAGARDVRGSPRWRLLEGATR